MKFFRIFFTLCLLHAFFFPVHSSQKNILNELFDQLEKVDNSKTAELLEKKIWSIWNEHPNDVKLTEKLEFGAELIEYGSYDYALKIFDNILATDPAWSEAWNKRATVFFLMKQYKKSLNDIEKVLKIESRHFGALSGQARIFIKLQEYEKAIISLKKALKFYPAFRSGELIPQIERLIKEESI
jgi:tetratricopeptide (TPR) repeat protein